MREFAAGKVPEIRECRRVRTNERLNSWHTRFGDEIVVCTGNATVDGRIEYVCCFVRLPFWMPGGSLHSKLPPIQVDPAKKVCKRRQQKYFRISPVVFVEACRRARRFRSSACVATPSSVDLVDWKHYPMNSLPAAPDLMSWSTKVVESQNSVGQFVSACGCVTLARTAIPAQSRSEKLSFCFRGQRCDNPGRVHGPGVHVWIWCAAGRRKLPAANFLPGGKRKMPNFL